MNDNFDDMATTPNDDDVRFLEPKISLDAYRNPNMDQGVAALLNADFRYDWQEVCRTKNIRPLIYKRTPLIIPVITQN